jgi:hypothetical protein
MHSDVLIWIVTGAPSLLMDLTYTLVNSQKVPGFRCPKTTDGESSGAATTRGTPGRADCISRDDEDSLDDLDEAVIGIFVDDNNGSGAANNQVGIYSESVNDAALLRFGIHFTTKQSH